MGLATHDRQRLRKILDLSDRLGSLRRRVREGVEAITRKDLTDELRSIAGSVVSIGIPGTLGTVQKEHRLGPHEVMVLLMLLNRRLEPGGSTLNGREILSTLFPSSYDMLSGISILTPSAPLRRSGTLEVVGTETEDLLEVSFGISDDLFRAVGRDVNPAKDRSSPPEEKPYANHWEHLADLGLLSTLLIRRSCALFELDPYGFRLFEAPEPAPVIDRRAEALAARIRRRIERTPEAESFPIRRLVRRLRLSEEEEIVLAALLFQECYYGGHGLEAVDCVKMVSRTPKEVLSNRVLLAPEGRLRQHGLVQVPDPMDEREFSAEVILPEWLFALLLGETVDGESRPIVADTRLEFHEYLKDLGDSEQFYRDLNSH